MDRTKMLKKNCGIQNVSEMVSRTAEVDLLVCRQHKQKLRKLRRYSTEEL